MIVARDTEHLERLLSRLNISYKRIIEFEDLFWVETSESKVFQVPKPRKKEEIEEILRGGFFPQKLINCVLYEERRKTEALRKALSVKGRGIIQEGKAGVGKTYALIFKIAMLLRYYKLNSPLYVPVQSFNIQQYREIYSDYDSYLIDDLNANSTEWKVEFIRELVYHAYNNDKLLFITTNTSVKTLFAEVIKEEPIISRLMEMCEIQHIKEVEDLRIRRKS